MDEGELLEAADVPPRDHDQSGEERTAHHDDVLVDVLGNKVLCTKDGLIGDLKRNGAEAAFSSRDAALASKP